MDKDLVYPFMGKLSLVYLKLPMTTMTVYGIIKSLGPGNYIILEKPKNINEVNMVQGTSIVPLENILFITQISEEDIPKNENTQG